MGLPLIIAILARSWKVIFVYSNKVTDYFFTIRDLLNQSVQPTESTIVIKTPGSIKEKI